MRSRRGWRRGTRSEACGWHGRKTKRFRGVTARSSGTVGSTIFRDLARLFPRLLAAIATRPRQRGGVHGRRGQGSLRTTVLRCRKSCPRPYAPRVPGPRLLSGPRVPRAPRRSIRCFADWLPDLRRRVISNGCLASGSRFMGDSGIPRAACATFSGAKPITEGEANGTTEDLEHRVPPPL